MFDFLGRMIDAGLGEITGTGPAQRAERAAQEQRRVNAENERLQKEFAKNSIQWKVADAKAAGIHPLAAMGASTATAAPSHVGADLDLSGGEMGRMMGQSLMRAAESVMTKDERDYNKAMQYETLHNARLKNQILESQVPGFQPQNPPLQSPTAVDGLGAQSGFVLKPAELTAASPGRPHQEAGAVSDYGYVRTQDGYALVPSKDVKERIEDNVSQEVNWAFRNQLLPISKGVQPPDPKHYPLPKGATKWEWNAWKQQFVPYFPKDIDIPKGSKVPRRVWEDYYKKGGW